MSLQESLKLIQALEHEKYELNKQCEELQYQNTLKQAEVVKNRSANHLLLQ